MTAGEDSSQNKYVGKLKGHRCRQLVFAPLIGQAQFVDKGSLDECYWRKRFFAQALSKVVGENAFDEKVGFWIQQGVDKVPPDNLVRFEIVSPKCDRFQNMKWLRF